MVYSVKTLVLLTTLQAIFYLANCELFPNGARYGDQQLPKDVDDVSSSEIHLKTPILFYEQIFSSIYINSNGLLSFLTDISSFYNIQFPLDYPVIAPFYSDVDTRGSGTIYYRESQSPELLEEVSEKIRKHFSMGMNFHAKSFLIVTWDQVGYYNSKHDQVNTFQAAIASDGENSFLFLIYDDIQWIYGEGKSANHPDARAQAGFMSGEGQVYLLVGSGTDQIRNIHRISNVGDRGLWMFHIGRTLPNGNVQVPDLNLGEAAITINSPQSCAVGAAFCHRHAQCVDYSPGFCCNCVDGYYGNGKNCLQNDIPQRLNGKVTGKVNDVSIEDSDLHSYVVTSEGRAYTAISRIGNALGFDMQILLPIGGIIGWLFAIQHSDAKNGYQLTGGIVNHTVEINFPQSGQHVKIQQSFLGLDVFNHLRLVTDIQGFVPSIPADTKIEIDDYEEEYTRVSPGVIRSHAKRNYRLENSHINTPFTIDQTIVFDECAYNPIIAELTTLRLKVARNYIVYDPREQVIRYTVTNKITPLVIEDPCIEGAQFCGDHSSCVVEGDSYRCVCNSGFQYLYDIGDYGETAACIDINECAAGKDDCHSFADCINQEGSYSCVCLPGYTGDGKTCEQHLQTCANIHCGENADCIQILGQGPECHCKFGFERSGTFCIESRFTDDNNCENDHDICDPNADCILNSETNEHQCQCLEGYTGNGILCIEELESCEIDNNCHQDATCEYEVRLQGYYCICNPGYQGDGYNCVPEEPVQQTCNVINNCHPHALCVFDASQNIHKCQCNAGYKGDGYQCMPAELSCNEVNMCSINAQCVYDHLLQRHVCHCNENYAGDGFDCSPIDECETDGSCDVNAKCELENLSGRYICQCNYGYVGNGKQCVPGTGATCQILNNCDPNAQCIYDPSSKQHRCQCNSGYQGDGYVCLQAVVSCNIHNNCHPKADCDYDTLEHTYRCQCHQGFIGDGLTCIPARSCLHDSSICDPNAECIDHSSLEYQLCHCKQGYQGDGYSCTVIPSHDGNFLLVNQGMATVRLPIKASFKDQGKPLVLIPHQTAVGIDIDCTLGKFYWTDIVGGAIRESDYNGNSTKTFIETNMISPECIAVDWVSRNLFWTDSGKDTIEVAKLDTQERKVLFNDGLSNPRGIAVHPGKGKIYWSDWEREAPRIEVANMDGTAREVFVGDNLGLPNSLTIDYERDDLCWADAGTQKIECIGLYGHNRRTAVAPVAYPFGLTNNRDTLFWTDWDTKSIQSASKAAYSLNKPITSPLGGNSKLYGIVAVLERCPRVSNQCAVNNGGCRYLCLPNGHDGRTCMCPDSGDQEEISACNEIS